MASDDEGVSWEIQVDRETDWTSQRSYEPTDEELAAIKALPPEERTHRGIKSALRVGGDKATVLLRTYRELLTGEEAS